MNSLENRGDSDLRERETIQDEARFFLHEMYRRRDEQFVQLGSMSIVGIETIREVFLKLEREGLVEFVRRPIPWPAWCVKLTELGVKRGEMLFSQRFASRVS